MPRFLADASVLIALAQVGELGLLQDVLREVHVTREVLEEVLHPDHPEREAMDAAVAAGWLRLAEARGSSARLLAFGLGHGEASLFLAAEPGDVLLLDELPARRLAVARGQPVTGLLGVLVAGVESGLVEKERGLRVLEALARGTFHMTVELYQDVRTRLEGA